MRKKRRNMIAFIKKLLNLNSDFSKKEKVLVEKGVSLVLVTKIIVNTFTIKVIFGNFVKIFMFMFISFFHIKNYMYIKNSNLYFIKNLC